MAEKKKEEKTTDLTKQESSTLLDRFTRPRKADFFPIRIYDGGQGKWVTTYEPSARIVNFWALQKKVSCEVLNSGKDNEKAWATVRGWRGKRTVCKQCSAKAEEILVERTAYVCHIYKDIIRSAILDACKNGWWDKGAQKQIFPEYDITEGGEPILKKKEDKLHVLLSIQEKVKFAERDAVTKAEKIVQRKLLGLEWREEVEIETDVKEIENIQAEKPEQPVATPKIKNGGGKK